jgi:hypothetical protein
VIESHQSRERALANYHRFSAQHAGPFRWMLRVQRLVPRVEPHLLATSLRAMGAKRFIDWSFNHYLNIAHPDFATREPQPRVPSARAA